VDGNDALAERFEAHRTRLRGVALRMLGSADEADDAVQEAWLRLHRAGADEVDNLGGWLTTVVARVCLDMLRSRKTRREDPHGDELPDAPLTDAALDPEREALLADAIGPALLVVLDTLGPAERLAFVLHDMFAVPFDEIGPILGRSSSATKMLASRARRRVQGGDPAGTDADPARQREVVRAFFAASRDGDFDGLLALLHPEAVVRADQVAVNGGADAELVGAGAVAGSFVGRAHGVQVALIDGVPGAAWLFKGAPNGVLGFTVVDGLVTEIEIIMDPERVAQFQVEVLGR
jgi:RNA polymerase sigma-70 factor (ECF subfamily)